MNRSWIRWVMWALACAFYFYEVFVRIAPSVMVQELMESFTVQAGAVGVVTACYFYAYAPAQIPVGILMDRFGARRLLTYASLLVGLSSILFGLAPNLSTQVFARAVMGLFSAFGFLGVAYITSHWFSARRLTVLFGLANSAAMLGGIAGQGPFGALIGAVGWRTAWLIAGSAGLLLAAAIYILVRNDPPSKNAEPTPAPTLKDVMRGFRIVCRHPQTWINAFTSFCAYGVTAAFIGFWGPAFFQYTYGMSATQAGFTSSLMYLGWLFGAPLIGFASNLTHSIRPVYCTAMGVCAILLVVLIFVPAIPAPWLYVLLLAIGVTASAQLLNYTFAIEINPKEAKGTAVALTNLISLSAGALLQSVVGWILVSAWDGEVVDGAPFYTFGNFQAALLVFPITVAGAFVLALFLKKIPWHEHLTEELVSLSYDH